MHENTNTFTDDESKKIIADIADRIHLNIDVIRALKENIRQRVKELMDPQKHPNIPSEEKETEILSQALLSFSLKHLDKSFFEYFIFEYNINEDIYINLDSEHKTKVVEDIFARKKLNEDLRAELEVNTKIDGKKLKV